MPIYKRLMLPLALVGGATLTAVLAFRLRHKHRREETNEQTTGLYAWEGEGGKLAAAYPLRRSSTQESQTPTRE